MTLDGVTLLYPASRDRERESVAEAWRRHGGETLAIDRFWEPPPLDPTTTRIYGGSTFALVLAQKLEIELHSPADDLLLHVDRSWLGRNIACHPLSHTDALDYPLFAKPLVPKLFRAGVYRSVEELTTECRGLDGATSILVSSIIALQSEARVFLLDGEPVAAAVYEGSDSVEEASAFAAAFARSVELPRGCVIDVGRIDSGELTIIEANAAWGAGLNGCDPARAVLAIAQASGGRKKEREARSEN